MSWLPHTIFRCHERQDSTTRDAQHAVCASFITEPGFRRDMPKILSRLSERVHKPHKVYQVESQHF